MNQIVRLTCLGIVAHAFESVDIDGNQYGRLVNVGEKSIVVYENIPYGEVKHPDNFITFIKPENEDTDLKTFVFLESERASLQRCNNIDIPD